MNNRIETLIDESFKKHHSIGILNRPFEPKYSSNRSARVRARFSVIGVIAAAAVFSVVFVRVAKMDKKQSLKQTTSEPTVHSIENERSESLDTTSESDNNSTYEEKTDKTPEYVELELHSDTLPYYTSEDADALVEKGVTNYEQNGREIIDSKKYADEILDGTLDKNSLTAKSYIYHMMLNSIDYYNSAEGSMIYDMNTSAPVNIEFQTDLEKQMSFEKTTQNNKAMDMECYMSGDVEYVVNNITKEVKEQTWASTVEYNISDNDRVIDTDMGRVVYNRNDLTRLGISGNSCLFPQSYATRYLCDFDSWSVTRIDIPAKRTCGNTNLPDRPCVLIYGIDANGSFYMAVDLYTGILFQFNKYDENELVTGQIMVADITIDESITVKSYDPDK